MPTKIKMSDEQVLAGFPIGSLAFMILHNQTLTGKIGVVSDTFIKEHTHTQNNETKTFRVPMVTLRYPLGHEVSFQANAVRLSDLPPGTTQNNRSASILLSQKEDF